jgi:homoserine kinase
MTLTSAPALHIKLPATSANLGPGFDALGLAMALYLTIDATVAPEFRIDATGRDAALCGQLENNLILTTYSNVLLLHTQSVESIYLRLHNEIPLGMGCGSSAAALLAGVILANHFGKLGWSSQQILEEACRREGHPDNVAACWLGGMTASAEVEGSIITATCGLNLDWKLLLAIPPESLATEKARALLPDHYSRADAVANVQSTALLVSAFALNRPGLLKAAMRDKFHQPFRLPACPLLGLLLPLRNSNGISGIALSGAGPSVLLIASGTVETPDLLTQIRGEAGDPSMEIIETRIAGPALFQS